MKLVNLVYRHLATVPGALEWAWSTVGPAFEEGEFADRSRALVSIGENVTADSISCALAGLTEEEGSSVLATLDAYNRANPMNAISLRVIATALEAGRPAGWRRPNPAGNGSLTVLLPMAPLDRVSAETMDILYRLAWLTTGQDRGLVPSLFRHFAAWPAFLTALADWLEPLAASGQIERQVADISGLANGIADDIFARLPPPRGDAVLPDASTRARLVETIEIFPPAICRMIVIGGLLRTAIKP